MLLQASRATARNRPLSPTHVYDSGRTPRTPARGHSAASQPPRSLQPTASQAVEAGVARKACGVPCGCLSSFLDGAAKRVGEREADPGVADSEVGDGWNDLPTNDLERLN